MPKKSRSKPAFSRARNLDWQRKEYEQNMRVKRGELVWIGGRYAYDPGEYVPVYAPVALERAA